MKHCLYRSLAISCVALLYAAAQTAVPLKGIEGDWAYKHLRHERSAPGLYPPEYIQLKITRNGEGYQGEYVARYRIKNTPPATPRPDVAFHLTSVDSAGRKFTWVADDGGQGTFEIVNLTDAAMRVEWHATRPHRFALSRGEATLVRAAQL